MKRTMNRPGGLVALLAAGCVALMAAGVVGSAQAAPSLKQSKSSDPRCPNGVNQRDSVNVGEGTRITSLALNFIRIENGRYRGRCFIDRAKARCFVKNNHARWTTGSNLSKAVCLPCASGRLNASIGQEVRSRRNTEHAIEVWNFIDTPYPSRCYRRATCVGGNFVKVRDESVSNGSNKRSTIHRCQAPTPPQPTCTGNHQAALPAGAPERARENGSFMSRGGTVYYGDRATNCFNKQVVPAGRTQCNNAKFGNPLDQAGKACFLVENPRYPAFVSGKSLNTTIINSAGQNPVGASNPRACRIACTRKRERGCHSWTFIERGHKNNPNRGLCYYRGQFDPARGHKFITYGTGRTSGVLQ